jgi:hypothetical protein
MLDEFKISRGLLSSYYIAAIFTYFLFQLPTVTDIVLNIATWLISFMTVTTIASVENSNVWYFLFFVCLCITTLIRRLIVYPLGFYINDEGAPAWELAVLAVLVLGFYVFLLNQVFVNTPMPSNIPPLIVRAVDGYYNSFQFNSQTSVEVRNTFVIVPWFWYIFPISFMYVKTLLMKDKNEK